MKRSIARELAMHMVYTMGFASRTAQEVLEEHLNEEQFSCFALDEPLYEEFPDERQERYIRQVVEGVYTHFAELDDYIARYAIGWSFQRIPRVAASIMRVAMYEILYCDDVPNSAAINEAVELSKYYEDEELTKFINGILGSFVRGEQIPDPAKGDAAPE